MADIVQRPLAGLLVLDFTWSVAGPTMTRYLASLGAEVIKVEWPAHPDPMRSAMYLRDETSKTLNNGPFFANLNVGKRSLTLNVRTEKGLAVARDLVGKSDVIAESFSAGVLERWGLGYSEISELNRSIIYVSVSGFGHTGRHRKKNTWGPTAQAMSGLTFMSGEPKAPPAGWGWSYLDVASGYMGAIGVLGALVRRRRTGEGCRLDMSQVEVGASLVGPALLDAVVNGGSVRRGVPGGNRSVGPDGAIIGYRGDEAAPNNVYPTSGGGPNDYCAVSISTDREWRSLKDALGSPRWAADERLETAAGRASRQDFIDCHLAEWMSRRNKYDAMATLQAHGVSAGAVQTARDRVEHDPQLRHRQIYQALDHPRLGIQRFEGVPFRSTAGPYSLKPRWPVLGADTERILAEVLGYSDEVISELRADHVLWPEGLPDDPPVERSLW